MTIIRYDILCNQLVMTLNQLDKGQNRVKYPCFLLNTTRIQLDTSRNGME